MERHFIFFAFILCVYLTFITQYSGILYPSQQLSYNIVVLFNLYSQIYILNKNWRPDMVTRKKNSHKLLNIKYFI